MTENVKCLAIGGCADGVLIPELHIDAVEIQLSRPTHIKPIKRSTQSHIEVAKQADLYNVHLIALLEGEDGEYADSVALAVLQGQTLTWAFDMLMRGYIGMEGSDERPQ